MTNNINPDNIIVRNFKEQDRPVLRQISIDTAFMGKPASLFFEGNKVLADVLTLYFTDYEPDSCFVAVKDNQVIGYIIGSKDVSVMERVFKFKILPRLIIESVHEGILLKTKNIRFFIHCISSVFRGEFFVPNFSREYPATFHINIDTKFRGLSIGKMLMEHYLSYLKQNLVSGVHCSTISEGAGNFFIKQGFVLLFRKKRTYWERYSGKDSSLYILGRKLK